MGNSERLDIRVLYEDGDVLALVKPTGVPSQGGRQGAPSVPELLPFEVFVVHRLDQSVGGVIVYAKTKRAASALSGALAAGEFRKTYAAVACGSVQSRDEITLRDFLVSDKRLNVSRIAGEGDPSSKFAVLHYRASDSFTHEKYGVLTRLDVRLETGRHHQIRVQLANAGLPIWGDKKYNPAFVRKPGYFPIALFERELSFPHPRGGGIITVKAEPEGFPFRER